MIKVYATVDDENKEILWEEKPKLIEDRYWSVLIDDFFFDYDSQRIILPNGFLKSFLGYQPTKNDCPIEIESENNKLIMKKEIK